VKKELINAYLISRRKQKKWKCSNEFVARLFTARQPATSIQATSIEAYQSVTEDEHIYSENYKFRASCRKQMRTIEVV
jgi:hypothetical protein